MCGLQLALDAQEVFYSLGMVRHALRFCPHPSDVRLSAEVMLDATQRVVDLNFHRRYFIWHGTPAPCNPMVASRPAKRASSGISVRSDPFPEMPPNN